MRLISILIRIGTYITRFGFVKGLKIYFILKCSKKPIININLKKFSNPIKLRTNASDVAIFKQVFLEEEYEFSLGFIPSTIIDAGANIGLSALFFTMKFPKTTIYSIEPELSNFKMLIENTKYYQNIFPHQKALSTIDNHTLVIQDNGFGTSGFMTVPMAKNDEDIASIKVSTISVMKVKQLYKLDILDVVKIDIEGFEKELFSSNTEWLKYTKCLIIELHDRMKKGCSQSVFKAINAYDFSFSMKGENLIFINNKLL